MKVTTVAAMLLLGLAASATAQEFTFDQSKLYVSDPAACQMLQDKGVSALEETDFLILSFADGIQGMEFHCNFFDVKSASNTNFLFVSAVCNLPGDVYPDTLSISPYDETTIQVVSSYDTMMAASSTVEPEDPATNSGITFYHRCDNLSELPR
ncbi:MAG TPA: hypothetical protein VL147_15940 [Devosia sp.]|nr:hypothetical protein [Devosia sp.]